MRDQLWAVTEPLTSHRKKADNHTETAILDDASGCILCCYHNLRQTLGYQVAYLTLVGTELGVDQAPRLQMGLNLGCLNQVFRLITKGPVSVH